MTILKKVLISNIFVFLCLTLILIGCTASSNSNESIDISSGTADITDLVESKEENTTPDSIETSLKNEETVEDESITSVQTDYESNENGSDYEKVTTESTEAPIQSQPSKNNSEQSQGQQSDSPTQSQSSQNNSEQSQGQHNSAQSQPPSDPVISEPPDPVVEPSKPPETTKPVEPVKPTYTVDDYNEIVSIVRKYAEDQKAVTLTWNDSFSIERLYNDELGSPGHPDLTTLSKEGVIKQLKYHVDLIVQMGLSSNSLYGEFKVAWREYKGSIEFYVIYG